MTDISVDPLRLINRDRWTEHARCRNRYDLFDYSVGQGTKRDAYAAALRICRECPVLAECTDFASRTETKGVVLAGAVYNDHGTPWRPRGRPRKSIPEEQAAELNEDAPDPETQCTVCGSDTATARCCGWPKDNERQDYDR